MSPVIEQSEQENRYEPLENVQALHEPPEQVVPGAQGVPSDQFAQPTPLALQAPDWPQVLGGDAVQTLSQQTLPSQLPLAHSLPVHGPPFNSWHVMFSDVTAALVTGPVAVVPPPANEHVCWGGCAVMVTV
jgi:hypothetical protein